MTDTTCGWDGCTSAKRTGADVLQDLLTTAATMLVWPVARREELLRKCLARMSFELNGVCRRCADGLVRASVESAPCGHATRAADVFMYEVRAAAWSVMRLGGPSKAAPYLIGFAKGLTTRLTLELSGHCYPCANVTAVAALQKGAQA